MSIMSSATRKIIHCDCDCFYAAVEMRDDPRLLHLPIAIGGKSDRRGVVATCNYKAREYGVRSAMPTAQALKLCRDLVVIPATMAKYREASLRIREIFYRYTDKVEPLSLDEAYLDVSDCTQCGGSATLIAAEIRDAIAKEVGVTASAGVAPSEFGQHRWLMTVSSVHNFPVTCCLYGQQLINYIEAAWLAGRVLGRGLIEPSFIHQARDDAVYERLKAQDKLHSINFTAILGTIPVAGRRLFDLWALFIFFLIFFMVITPFFLILFYLVFV